MTRFRPDDVNAAVEDIVSLVTDNSGKACGIAFHIRDLLLSGEQEQAVKLLVSILRTGRASSDVQWIAAVVLEDGQSADRRPGRPNKYRPTKWLAIGKRFYELVHEGKNRAQAKQAVANEFGTSATPVDEAIRFYDAFNAKVLP